MGIVFRIISPGFKGISIEKCLLFGRKHINSDHRGVLDQKSY
jgi:hypothetical protein